MPKDTEKNFYYTIAVPKNSRLQLYIDAVREDVPSIAPGQLIVLYAATYVKEVEGGALPAISQYSKTPSIEITPETGGVQIIHLDPPSSQDFSAFGEPD